MRRSFFSSTVSVVLVKVLKREKKSILEVNLGGSGEEADGRATAWSISCGMRRVSV